MADTITVSKPSISGKIVVLFTIFTIFSCEALDNPYRHVELINPKYLLQWVVNLETKIITFNVTAQTTGYVALGLSKEGLMDGADIVIGGVNSNGETYFTDRHGVENQAPIIDASQDWTIEAGWENGTHTSLRFSRPFDTCDEDDLDIHDDLIALIWAYGETDNYTIFHYQNRGSYPVYLLDPDISPRGFRHGQTNPINPETAGDTGIWYLQRSEVILSKPTTYVCSMHKAPSSSSKRHIIGFNSVLDTALERRHIHHFLLHRCYAPPGQDPVEVFDRFVGTSPEECYQLENPIGTIPTHYCQDSIHLWAVGGKAMFFPEHAGMPFSESPNEYYMLQSHYDNPDQISGMQLNWGLEVYYTDTLRTHDAGVLQVGEATPGTPAILVPPGTLAHDIYGHCGSGCTKNIFPPEGIHIFAVFLHTHLAGTGTRQLHLRNNEELPWMTYDDNYNFNYQQIRLLREERTALPGDMIINRCTYQTVDRNGSALVGGFATRNEMCNGYIWYYNLIPDQGMCRSEMRSDTYNRFLDMWNMTWSNDELENIVTAPERNAGLLVSEVATNRIDWTIEKREQLQKFHRYYPRITECYSMRIGTGNGSTTATTTTSPATTTSTTTVAPSQAPTSPVQPNSRWGRKKNGGRWRRSTGFDMSAAIQEAENAIVDPESESVSIYPADITPYERTRQCGPN